MELMTEKEREGGNGESEEWKPNAVATTGQTIVAVGFPSPDVVKYFVLLKESRNPDVYIISKIYLFSHFNNSEIRMYLIND